MILCVRGAFGRVNSLQGSKLIQVLPADEDQRRQSHAVAPRSREASVLAKTAAHSPARRSPRSSARGRPPRHTPPHRPKPSLPTALLQLRVRMGPPVAVRWSALLVFAGTALLYYSPVQSMDLFYCPKGCPAECPQYHCEETVMDNCGCCQICVVSEGEPCGPQVGACGGRSFCKFNNESSVGICTAMEPNKKCKRKCSPAVHPICPEDSKLAITPILPGECCESPGVCVCDLDTCTAEIPDCDYKAQLIRVLIQSGRGEPGKCCDKYECREIEPFCKAYHCPLLSNEAESYAKYEKCPEDSFRPPLHITADSCCPYHPECKCRPSICQPAQCNENERVKVKKRGNGTPGQCCDVWQCEKANFGKNCTHNDKVYRDGQEWHPSLCESCQCKRGVAHCSKMTCPKPPARCTWVGVPSGECCPVCLGCQMERNGVLDKRKFGEDWNKDDCTTCSCSQEGENLCLRALCMVECENPRRVEGQCCPVCDEPTIFYLPPTCKSMDDCPLRCTNGLKRNDDGCFSCECVPSRHPSVCSNLTEHNCDKQCAHGYTQDESGCAKCHCAKCPPLHQCRKHCIYGFETNAIGCPVCKCRARIDAKLTISEHNDAVMDRDKCASSAVSGKVTERDGGEWWNDGCRHCFCENKREFCSLISCPDRPTSCSVEKWVQKDYECCPSCLGSPSPTTTPTLTNAELTVCHSPGSGSVYTDGETWQLTACVSCTCRMGYVLCRSISCAPASCAQPVADENNTCCSNGTIECFRESCPNVGKCKGHLLAIKGRCCPLCSDVLHSGAVCKYGNAVYSHREEWRDGPCRNCSCIGDGQTVCREVICPPCSKPVPISGQCCPLCKDAGTNDLPAFGASFPDKSSSAFNGSTIVGVASFVAFGVLIVFLVSWWIRRKNQQVKQPKSHAKVQLSSCKMQGSLPHLVENFERRGRRDTDNTDGQSESLLSTTSESSAGMSAGSMHSEAQLLNQSVRYHV